MHARVPLPIFCAAGDRGDLEEDECLLVAPSCSEPGLAARRCWDPQARPRPQPSLPRVPQVPRESWPIGGGPSPLAPDGPGQSLWPCPPRAVPGWGGGPRGEQWTARTPRPRAEGELTAGGDRAVHPHIMSSALRSEKQHLQNLLFIKCNQYII